MAMARSPSISERNLRDNIFLSLVMMPSDQAQAKRYDSVNVGRSVVDVRCIFLFSVICIFKRNWIAFVIIVFDADSAAARVTY